jgi:hypothetical protein
MDKPSLTRRKVILAFAIAGVADLIQIPITAATTTGLFSIPGELADFLVDCVVMIAASWLIGFHWVLLPSFVLEAIPGPDLLPTWTASVAYVVWRRKKERAQQPPIRPAVVQEAPMLNDRPKA